MTPLPLLAFVGVVILFVIATLYVFSRISLIRVAGDAARLMMTAHLVLAAVIVVATLIALVT